MTIKVLFICKANICRSPMAHGVFETQVQKAGLSDQIEVDSAGTHSYHVGVQPDHRAQRVAAERGYQLSDQKAQLLSRDLGDHFDYLVAMDSENYQDARLKVNEADQKKVVLLLDFSAEDNKDIPDPFFSGSSSYGHIPDPMDFELRGFESVLDMIEVASGALLNKICEEHTL